MVLIGVVALAMAGISIQWRQHKKDQKIAEQISQLGGRSGMSDDGFYLFGRIDWVDLHDCKLSDDDLRLLRQLRYLKSLGLRNTALTDSALDEIESLSQLRGLDLAGTKFSKEGRARLREKLPDCNIRD
jgi:hypothetical protein